MYRDSKKEKKVVRENHESISKQIIQRGQTKVKGIIGRIASPYSIGSPPQRRKKKNS